MKRYKYPWKFEATTFGRLFEVIPTTRIAVVPGDTLQGNIEIRFHSDTLKKPIMHSAMLEYYLFYVPNRLTEDDWQDFITDNGGTILNNTSAVPRFFEPVATTANRNALYRLAYWSIVNEFFRDPDDGVVPVGTEPYAANRIPTFRSTARKEQGADTTVSTAGDVLNINEMRRAITDQRWEARREAFGDRYVDVMRSMGVNPNWAKLERPEFLGKMSKRVTNNITTDTSATTTGSPSSDFSGTFKFNLERKAFDEHGFVVGVTCWRPRVTERTQSPPDAFDYARTDFWSPEFEGQGMVGYPDSIWIGSQNTGTTYFHPKFQHLRVPDDHYFVPGSSPTTEWTISTAANQSAPVYHRRPIPTSFNDYFRNNIGGNYHYAVNAWHNLDKFSPVKPLPTGV